MSPLPGVRGEPQEGRGSHTLLRRPRSRPLPVSNLKGSKGGGGEREVLAGAEAEVAGVAPPRFPPALPLALSGVLITSFHFSQDAGDPRGGGAG